MHLKRLILTLSLLASAGIAQTFTGPTSAYYLDNYSTRTIYVVQGTSVINSFAWAYGADANGNAYNEGAMAVSDTVNTRPWPASNSNANGEGGQYTLNGTPTGVTEGYPLPSGTTQENSYDGTSDGTHNYYVEYDGIANGLYTENVYQTDLTWQNPTKLFSVQSNANQCCEYLGIAYDPTNQSLWISGWDDSTIRDYALNGTLQSSFGTGQCCQGALGYDVADNTLWVSQSATNQLRQYSTTGTVLQSGAPTGLAAGSYLAGDFSSGSGAVPEPTSILLLGTVAGTLIYAIRRKRFTA